MIGGNLRRGVDMANHNHSDIGRSSMEHLASPRRPRVLLCASGSVATVKVPELAVRLHEFADVKIIVTKAAEFFLARAQDYDAVNWNRFQNLRADIPVLRDEDEWAAWNVVGDAVLHIDLKDWADAMVLAPLSANTLGKLANGLSDNLLTCVARAWIMSKPFIYAPAMNTDMWNHPMTARHLKVLDELGYLMVDPVEKKLACGVVGKGGLAPVDGIVSFVKSTLAKSLSTTVE